MASRVPAGAQAAALAPAGIGLALLILVVQIRMEDPWASGVLLVVAALGAVPLLLLGLAAAEGDDASRAAVTTLLVGGLLLGGATIARLGDVLGGDDFLAAGGTFTWMLALFTALAAFCARRTGSSACVLIAALAAVGFALEFANWVFGAEDIDTFRVLLAIAFAILFGAGVMLTGRTATMLVAAAGVTVIAGYYTTGIGLLFGGDGGLGWGWELITLLEGIALAAYAAQRLEPGPAYLAFFVLLLFAATAAIVGGGAEGGVTFDGEEFPTEEESSASLLGWPLVLALGTVAAALAGLRRQTAARS
jgi:hypothetical protein